MTCPARSTPPADPLRPYPAEEMEARPVSPKKCPDPVLDPIGVMLKPRVGQARLLQVQLFRPKLARMGHRRAASRPGRVFSTPPIRAAMSAGFGALGKRQSPMTSSKPARSAAPLIALEHLAVGRRPGSHAPIGESIGDEVAEAPVKHLVKLVVDRMHECVGSEGPRVYYLEDIARIALEVALEHLRKEGGFR